MRLRFGAPDEFWRGVYCRAALKSIAAVLLSTMLAGPAFSGASTAESSTGDTRSETQAAGPDRPAPWPVVRPEPPEIVLAFRDEQGRLIVEGTGTAAHLVGLVDDKHTELGIAQVSLQGLWRVVIEASSLAHGPLSMTPVSSPLLPMAEFEGLPAPYPIEREGNEHQMRAEAIVGQAVDFVLSEGGSTTKELLYQTPSPERRPKTGTVWAWAPPYTEDYPSYRFEFDPFLVKYYSLQPIPMTSFAAGLTVPSEGLGSLGVELTQEASFLFATNRNVVGRRVNEDVALEYRKEFGIEVGPLVVGQIEMRSLKSKGSAKTAIEWQDRKEWSAPETPRNMRQYIGRAKLPKDVLVIIHGCCVDFKSALESAAKLVKDLRYDGAAVLFSWPAAGYSMAYRHDVDKATASRKDFLNLLGLLAGLDEIERIHILAHSLGNQILLEALRDVRSLESSNKITAKLGQLIFASPDVDDQVFQSAAAAIFPLGKGATLYASARDKPLQISGLLAWGGQRAGYVGDGGPLVAKGVDSIDVTHADSEWFGTGHSLFASALPIVNDLSLLIAKGERPPDVRFPILETVKTQDGPYWRYPSRR